jgi:hypothetical protein
MGARYSIIGVIGLLIAGCTVTRQVHLYPLGPPGEVMQGVIVGHGQGHGTARLLAYQALTTKAETTAKGWIA